MAEQLYKYPRTQHVEGSRFQPGDDDLDCAPFADLQEKYIVVEEKLDGANAGRTTRLCSIFVSPSALSQLFETRFRTRLWNSQQNQSASGAAIMTE